MWGAAYVPKKTAPEYKSATTAAKPAVIPANEKPTERVMPANTSTTPAASNPIDKTCVNRGTSTART